MAVHAGEQEFLKRDDLVGHRRTRTPRAHQVCARTSATLAGRACAMRRCVSPIRSSINVARSTAARSRRSAVPTSSVAISLSRSATTCGPDQRRVDQIVQREQVRTQAIVDVVIHIGDVVGQRGDLRFQPRPGRKIERPARSKRRDRARQRCAPLDSGPLCLTRPSSVSQVRLSPSKSAIAMFELGDEPERMGIVVEAAEFVAWPRSAPPRRHGRTACDPDRAPAPRASARSSSSASTPRHGAGDLRHFQRMGEPRAVIIAFMLHEDLRLVLEPAKGRGMDDAVAVALIAGARRAFRLGIEAAAAGGRHGRIGRMRLSGPRIKARSGGPAAGNLSKVFAPAPTRTT